MIVRVNTAIAGVRTGASYENLAAEECRLSQDGVEISFDEDTPGRLET